MPKFLQRLEFRGEVIAFTNFANKKRFESLHRFRGMQCMIDRQEHFSTATEELEGSPPPPLFDESAAAHAQPVQPISSNRFGRWLQRPHIQKIFTRRVLAFAIVIVSGFLAGAAGAVMFVKHQAATDSAPHIEEQSAAAEEANNKEIDEAAAASPEIAPVALPARQRAGERRRRRSSIPRGELPQRAYKVATIR
jgi:hypothetical protein